MSDGQYVKPPEPQRVGVYPRSVKGAFRKLKYSILAMAYSVYFLLPFLRWEREVGPSQAVLFDIQDRRFYLFDLVVYPQDIFWLAGFLMIAAFLLFFVTGLAGRVFCGYFCFQTLWTDVFIFLEKTVQGERPARMKLDKAPWSADKLVKKGLTHILWLLVAFMTGMAFTLYWGDAFELVKQFFTGEAPFPAYATTFFLTATTYVMAGLAREQVCTFMCPYARFQSAMFDTDTLIIAYDEKRGEGEKGRHKLAKGLKKQEERTEQGHGDCVDCGYCVQVCPVGIDIRNGLQYQCITCGLCIDACNTIMDSVGWEKNLISYTSERSLEGGKTRFLKPKNWGYGVMLVAIVGLLMYSISVRVPLDISISQVRQPLFVTLSDGRIQNSYELKLNNKMQADLEFLINIRGLEGAELDMGRIQTLKVPAGRSLRVLARVRYDASGVVDEQMPFYIDVSAMDRDDVGTVSKETQFSLPGAKR